MVQKTSMSRGPYPSSQEIPMEVFDPSPQVRCDGRDRGKGAAPVDLVGSDRGGTGEKGVICPAWRGKGSAPPIPASE